MIRWIHASSFLVTAFALFAFVAAPGCTPAKKDDSDKTKEKGKDKGNDKGHEHSKFGPHGGPLADLEDTYHGEVTIDHPNKMVVVYLLDDHAKKAPTVEASRFSKVKLVISSEKVSLDLSHDAKKSGPDGIVYTGTHDFFAKTAAFKGNFSLIVDENKKGMEKRYSDDFDFEVKK